MVAFVLFCKASFMRQAQEFHFSLESRYHTDMRDQPHVQSDKKGFNCQISPPVMLFRIPDLQF